MSAEVICDTLGDIIDLLGESKLNAKEIKSIYHWRENDGTHVAHIRKNDDTVMLLRFAPN